MGAWGCVLLLVMSGLVVLFKVLSFEVTGRNFKHFDTCLEIHRGKCVQHRTWTQSHANDPRHRDPTMALRNHYFHKQHQIWPEVVIRSVTNHGGERHIQWPRSWCLSVAPKPRAGFRQFWSWAIATALCQHPDLKQNQIICWLSETCDMMWYVYPSLLHTA